MKKRILTWMGAIALVALSAVASDVSALTIEKNKSVALTLDKGAQEVFVANPEIADVQMPKPPLMYLYGRKPGVTTVYVKDGKGNPKEIPVHVTHNLSQMMQNFKSLHPADDVTAVSTPMGIMLAGTVGTPKASADAELIAKHYLDDKEKVINNISVSSSTQVMLKVKIAEVRRDVLNKLDFNWSSSIPGASKHFSYGVLAGRSPSLTSDAAGALAGDGIFGRNLAENAYGSLGARFTEGQNSYTALLDILNSEGMGTILAEPTLVALSGESASFLVGGEFPVPVPQGSSTISIEYKQFGVLLSFIPTVMGNKQINLRVKPEVSEIDQANSQTIPIGGVPFQLRSLKTRKAETSIELASGQSMAIAGLFSSDISNLVKEIPGLAELPIIGALFKSTQFQRKQTELVVIITPFLVEGNKENQFSKPTDTLRHANLMEALFLGRVNDPDPAAARMQNAGHIHGVGGFYVE